MYYQQYTSVLFQFVKLNLNNLSNNIVNPYNKNNKKSFDWAVSSSDKAASVTDEQYGFYCIEIQYQQSELYWYLSYFQKIPIPEQY